MSIIIMKKRFEAPPNKDEILNLLVGDNVGDKAKAKDALINILAPMKDLLALYQFVDELDAAASNYANLLKEQETVKKSIVSLKAETLKAKQAYDAAVNQQAFGAKGIEVLEKQKADLAKEVEDVEKSKLRINKAVSDEYDRLRAEMLGNVAKDEEAARTTLESLETSIALAREELDNMAKKKEQFIASLTG